MAKELNWNGTEIGAKASNVTYDNSGSGMDAKNVQQAIDELKRKGGGGGGGSYAPFNGKRFAIVGDSFTAGGRWVGVMKNLLHILEIKNKAISGGTWNGDGSHTSLCAFYRLQLLYADYLADGTSPDYIIIVDGVNDFGNNAVLGDISYATIDDITNTEESALLAEISGKYDLSTFTGGAQAALAYIAARFPGAIVKIGWTPAGQQYMFSRITSAKSWDGVNQYLDRLKALATMYGVQYIDSINAGICPWVSSNLDKYSVSATDHHPNSDANDRIGEYMARLMLSNL